MTHDGAAFEARVARLRDVTDGLVAAMGQGQADAVLENASIFLEVLGHLVVAWP